MNNVQKQPPTQQVQAFPSVSQTKHQPQQVKNNPNVSNSHATDGSTTPTSPALDVQMIDDDENNEFNDELQFLINQFQIQESQKPRFMPYIM